MIVDALLQVVAVVVVVVVVIVVVVVKNPPQKNPLQITRADKTPL
jgi:hypothetical protein